MEVEEGEVEQAKIHLSRYRNFLLGLDCKNSHSVINQLVRVTNARS